EGLRPWQPRKLYFSGGFGGGRGGSSPAPAAAELSPANTAGDGPLPAWRGGGRGGGGGYQLMDTTISGQMGKDETSLFDGVNTSLAAVAQFAGPKPPEPLTDGLEAIVNDAR